MAIGSTLQEARLKKQMTTSQVAEMTRMKVQIVDDLERDDFHRIAATIYGKGFIKLFAECVGLDPKPLIADYVRSVEGDKPSLIPDGASPTPEPPPAPPKPAPVQEPAPEEPAGPEGEELPPAQEPSDLFAYAQTKRRRVRVERPAPRQPVVKQTIAEKASEAGSAVRTGWGKSLDVCRATATSLLNRLADIRWGDAPLKVIGIVLGVLLVLLFVVSGISSCAERRAAKAPADDTLELAVDAPEPYFD
jgi:transcriptional regulator with XRE-family HTH domain